MNNQALRYYMHDGPTAFRFELAGNLNHAGAQRLDRDWRTASSVIGERRLIIDITFVTGVDEEARALLARWHREGAQLVADSKASRALAESIVGGPVGEPAPASGHTWLPFRATLLPPLVTLSILLATLVFPATLHAATLRPETVAAWESYVQTVNADLERRVRPGGRFLWTLEEDGRAARVRGGEIVTAPAPGQNPKKVTGGLIHHWVGAMFLPNLKLDQMVEVTRDYDRYKEFYSPSVIESKTIARNGLEDRFSMMLMNKAFFLKTAIDADYHATNVRLDEHRFYSVSRTTRVQEVEGLGEPGEHRAPEGAGGGYIWKLLSIARFEQRDGGVYLELEAIALSREIPVAVRLVADPIVRRVSRNSLLISLRQTEDAVNGSRVTAAKSEGVAVTGEPASLSNNRSAFSAH